MTGISSSPVVRIERVIRAPSDRVFAAWTDPALLARWMSPVGHAEVEVEPWVGGRLHVTMISPGVRIEHVGDYRELVPGLRLVFTWRSPYTGDRPSVVTVELEPIADGTLLTLVHEQLPTDQVEPHTGGWGQILDRLAAVLASDKAAGR